MRKKCGKALSAPFDEQFTRATNPLVRQTTSNESLKTARRTVSLKSRLSDARTQPELL